MQAVPEAFLLLSLPNCTISFKDVLETGPLGLECVTIPIPEASGVNDRDVYLVLKLNMSETPIDPARTIQRSDTPVSRVYTFYGTPADPTELVLTIPTPPGGAKSTPLDEDLNTFEGILAQYAVDFRSPFTPAQPQPQSRAVPNEPPPSYANDDNKDLRGHLVMINEDTGEVIGEVEDRFRIQEDPVMYQRGHESDPVVIEVPDEAGLRESDASALEAFARIVPPDQRDWITKSATVVSHAISFTTNLLVTTITTASNLYISKSSPSPHHSSLNVSTANVTANEKGTTSPQLGSANHSPTPPPLPPRALVFLTSERTRKGLRSVHTVSGQAVKVSAKTVRTIDNMIRRAMGARPKENRLNYIPAPHGSISPVPSASMSPPPPPPPVIGAPYATTGSAASYYATSSPHLQPQPFQLQPQPQQFRPITPPLPPPKLSTTRRILISADLVLSTIDDSTRRLLDTGTENIGRVVHHKYGAEAAESSLLAAGTARNVALVYVDMKGMGRRALLRRAGMSFVKGQVQSDKERSSRPPVPPRPGPSEGQK
ncbi:hypothetical protein P691DRAFT_694194, partial [Macrolepiota fuliginosa MF-IS2]